MCGINDIQFFQGDLKFTDVIKRTRLKDMDRALNVCDLTRVIHKFNEWRKILPRIKPFYAVKCNNDKIIMKVLADLGAGFDCASENEIKQVLEMGVEPHRIIFANPCKPILHLDYARNRNVATGTFDNEFEVYKIFKNYPQSSLVIRFRCEAKQAQCPLGDKFGCDVQNDATALMLLAKSLGLNVTGTSFHVGSGCNDYLAYDRAINSAKNLHKFGKFIGLEIKILDIGGGFPGSDDDSFRKIADIVNASIDKYFPDEGIEIIAEPGRYFVAAACTLICKIHAKRETRNAGKLDTQMYYLNDGVYGSFNCILYDHQHVTLVHYLDDENLPKFKTSIWGPTCDALDKIMDNVYLPNLSCGDFIGFPNMGAYTLPVASTFNGFPLPKTIYFLQIQN